MRHRRYPGRRLARWIERRTGIIMVTFRRGGPVSPTFRPTLYLDLGNRERDTHPSIGIGRRGLLVAYMSEARRRP
jgi:hypothetical protein